MPSIIRRRFGLFSTGRGNTAWQRQQTSLSSGFQVPHSVQSDIRLPRVNWVEIGLAHANTIGGREQTVAQNACIPKWARTLVYLWPRPEHGHAAIKSEVARAPSLTPNPCPLAPAFLGGRAYSALPCAGAPPPQRPLSYNIRRRPGVDIRDGCLIERVRPDRVPPVPSDPRRCLPSHPRLTNSTVRPGTRTASRQKAVNRSRHRWHRFPARLFPPQIRDAPPKSDLSPIPRPLSDAGPMRWLFALQFWRKVNC